MTMSTGELTKAYLVNLETGERIQCLFNPNEYSISKTNSWKEKSTKNSNVPRLEFTGGGPTQLKLDLFFDTYESGGSARDYVRKIVSLTQISQSGSGDPEPPRCMFSWGANFEFEAVITNLSARFTLFQSDGTPVRAVVSLTLKECKDPQVQKRQNPTSQGAAGHKVWVVRPGDTINGIAATEYGDPTIWRVIADANDLDNPMDLHPGQILVLEPLVN